MAPEIIKSNPLTKMVDFWALGIMIYEMFSKKTPF
jgi:serine/threonine protein kinase